MATQAKSYAEFLKEYAQLNAGNPSAPPPLTEAEYNQKVGGGGSLLGTPEIRPEVPEEHGYAGAGGETPPTDTTKTSSQGGMGTWETALMSVSKTAPELIKLMQQRQPNAPAANVGGRRPMDIPSAATVYGKPDEKFQSLLAMYLRGR